jgi:hypothetical protein
MIAALAFLAPLLQVGQCCMSMSETRLGIVAQRTRCGRRWPCLASLPVVAAVSESCSCCAGACCTTSANRPALGASTPRNRTSRRLDFGLHDAAHRAAVEGLDRAVQRADDAGGERRAEPEGGATRPELPADGEVAAGVVRDRRQALYRHVDLRHRQVTLRDGADQRGVMRALVRLHEAGRARAGDPVIVDDDVAAVASVPGPMRRRATGRRREAGEAQPMRRQRGILPRSGFAPPPNAGCVDKGAAHSIAA